MITLTKFADGRPEAIWQDASAVTISGAPNHTVWVHFKGVAGLCTAHPETFSVGGENGCMIHRTTVAADHADALNRKKE